MKNQSRLYHLARFALMAILMLCILAQGKITSAAPHAQDAKIVADLGFRPETDGLPFPNYGPGPYTNLTPDDLRRAFGDEVCASLKDGKCILIPPGEELMAKLNGMMDGGHCYGFSVLALRLYQNQANLSDFKADKPP